MPQFGDGLLRRAGCKIDGAEPPFCCCSPSRNVAGLVRPHSRRTNKRVASKRSVGRFCVGHARTANSSPDAKPSGILTAATLPDELRVAAVSPIGHAANTRKNPVCTRDHPQINPRTGHRISSMSRVARAPLLTLNRPVWLTIRTRLNVRRGRAKGGRDASDAPVCDHFGPNSCTRVKHKVCFAFLILGATVTGSTGGSGDAWRSQWVNTIGSRAQVQWQRYKRTFGSICSPPSGLCKTPRVRLRAQNVATGSCPRANCELCAWGSTARGIRRGQSEKRWPQTAICESSS